MTEAKPTPGPWSVQEGDVWCDWEGKPNAPLFRQATEYRRWGRDISPSERTANAHLCAEAGTVYHETGLTPRQLAEQRAELLGALERITAPLDCGCKPCTGGCRSEDALRIVAEEFQDLARAAIAKAKGGEA